MGCQLRNSQFSGVLLVRASNIYSRCSIAFFTAARCSAGSMFSAASKVGPCIFLVLPLVGSIALDLVADIDSPRSGVIRVQPQNLISLAQPYMGTNRGKNQAFDWLLRTYSRPSRPGEFHPEPLTEPCLTVPRHTARATP
jgi:hypothetical protein